MKKFVFTLILVAVVVLPSLAQNAVKSYICTAVYDGSYMQQPLTGRIALTVTFYSDYITVFGERMNCTKVYTNGTRRYAFASGATGIIDYLEISADRSTMTQRSTINIMGFGVSTFYSFIYAGEGSGPADEWLRGGMSGGNSSGGYSQPTTTKRLCAYCDGTGKKVVYVDPPQYTGSNAKRHKTYVTCGQCGGTGIAR